MRIVRFSDRPFVAAGHENPAAPGVWKKVFFQRPDLQPGVVQMVNWARLPPGKRFASHYHEDMQEIFVVMQGEAEITVGSQTAVLGRGDAVLIDAREVHSMQNLGSDDCEYLAVGITAGTGGRTIVVEG